MSNDAIDRTGVHMNGEKAAESDVQRMARRATEGLNQSEVDLGIRGVEFKQYFQVRVDGTNMSQPFEQHIIAEQFILRLSREDQLIAEIVNVTASGQEILLG